MKQFALQETYPEIRKIGAQLTAITPGKNPLPAEHPLSQVASQMGVGPKGDGRSFPVLWDEGNRVADLFGLKHDFSDATKGLYRAARGSGLDTSARGDIHHRKGGHDSPRTRDSRL